MAIVFPPDYWERQAQIQADLARRARAGLDALCQGFREGLAQGLARIAIHDDSARYYERQADLGAIGLLDLSLDTITRPGPGDALALRGEG